MRITQGSMNFETVRLTGDREQTLRGLITKHMKAAQTNSLADLPTFSDKTWKKWMERIGGVVRLGDKKAKARINTKCIRTPLAYAAVLSSVFTHGNLSFETFIQSDDLSIMLFPSMLAEKPQVVTNAAALAWLREYSRGVSFTPGEIYKQRVMGIHISLQYDCAISKVLKIYDRSFECCKTAPKIFEMGDHWYVACCHPSLDQLALAYHVAVLCTEREGERLRFVNIACFYLKTLLNTLISRKYISGHV